MLSITTSLPEISPLSPTYNPVSIMRMLRLATRCHGNAKYSVLKCNGLKGYWVLSFEKVWVEIIFKRLTFPA